LRCSRVSIRQGVSRSGRDTCNAPLLIPDRLFHRRSRTRSVHAIGINIAVTAQTSIIGAVSAAPIASHALRMLIYIYINIYIYIYIYIYMYICYIYQIIYTSALYEWNAERANAPKLSYDYTQVIRGADITSLAWCGRYLRDEMSSRRLPYVMAINSRCCRKIDARSKCPN